MGTTGPTHRNDRALYLLLNSPPTVLGRLALTSSLGGFTFFLVFTPFLFSLFFASLSARLVFSRALPWSGSSPLQVHLCSVHSLGTSRGAGTLGFSEGVVLLLFIGASRLRFNYRYTARCSVRAVLLPFEVTAGVGSPLLFFILRTAHSWSLLFLAVLSHLRRGSVAGLLRVVKRGWRTPGTSVGKKKNNNFLSAK